MGLSRTAPEAWGKAAACQCKTSEPTPFGGTLCEIMGRTLSAGRDKASPGIGRKRTSYRRSCHQRQGGDRKGHVDRTENVVDQAKPPGGTGNALILEPSSKNKPTRMALDNIFARPRSRVKDFNFGEETTAVFDDMLDRSVPFYGEMQRMVGEMASDLPRWLASV